MSSEVNVSLYNLNSIIGCNHVYEGITFAESRICSQGISNMWALIGFYIWLFISVFFFSISIDKLKPLIDKKKLEIEVK
jgi:hypothetical protein